MGSVLRRWLPSLALTALGVGSLVVLHGAHLESRHVFEQTVASLDNISESRRHLLHAYLVYSRRSLGDPSFEGSSSLAELRAARYALQNWAAGRSGMLAFAAAEPRDSAFSPVLRRYAAALDGVQATLQKNSHDPVELRRAFSTAEEAASDLESAIRDSVRRTMAAEEQAYRFRLGIWVLLLLLIIAGAAYARWVLRRTDEHRLEAESRLSTLRELAPVGIAECDRDGGILAANPTWAGFTGQATVDWLGRPWWEALRSDDRDLAQQLWQREAGNEAQTAQARLAHVRDGAESAAWVLIRAGDRRTDSTGAERRVVTITDITEQRSVEEQLHHAQRMEAVGRLAGGVAHDFNNLLTSIGGLAALAADETEGGGPLVDDLTEIQRAVDRGRALTRQLLTFSRHDRTDPRILDARTVVGDLNRMLGRLVPEDVAIETSLTTAPALVLADTNQLEQVITNLVINAADAMDGHGRIRIALETVRLEEALHGEKSEIQPGCYVLLSVSDTGPGIPPGVRERIFEPFFTTKERGKGTGLGLSTVWGIVRQGGGHIHVYSAVGQGTVFKIYIPAATGTILPEQASAAAGKTATVRAGTVLVVEDEAAVRRLTCRVLELRGWKVLEAPDGSEALRIAAAHPDSIDLVITDLMMRGMGGTQFIQELGERGVRLPTLFVSGYAESQLDLGGARFLEKPFTPSALVRAVEAVMAAEGSRRPETAGAA